MTAKRGRPSDYLPEYAAQAEKLCKLGATDMEVAEFFGVDVRTIYRWKSQNADFCQAVKVGKDFADDRVERALYNRAVGYTFDSEKVFQFQGQIVRAKTLEHVPPDPGAAFNWLKNRRGAEWRDKHEVEHTNRTAMDMTDDELARIARSGSKGTAEAANGAAKPDRVH